MVQETGFNHWSIHTNDSKIEFEVSLFNTKYFKERIKDK